MTKAVPTSAAKACDGLAVETESVHDGTVTFFGDISVTVVVLFTSPLLVAEQLELLVKSVTWALGIVSILSDLFSVHKKNI